MFDSLLQSLTVLMPYLGDSVVVFSLAVGVAFALIALSVMYLVSSAVDPVRQRLSPDQDKNALAPSMAKKIDRAVTPIKGSLVPTKAADLSEIRRRMMYAGYRGSESITAFYAIKMLLILVFAIVGGLVTFLYSDGGPNMIILAIFSGAGLGLFLPSYILDKKIAKRREQIVNGFPDVLDLIVACSEAGLGLNAAIQRVARETSTMYPILSMELESVNSEIRAGVDRIEALRGLADRTGVDEVRGFVSMISQSVKFGTSISETLRIYAEEFRDKRMQRAEEQAAKVGTKLIFPLVCCIFPSFFVVSIGPAVISIIRVFEKLG